MIGGSTDGRIVKRVKGVNVRAKRGGGDGTSATRRKDGGITEAVEETCVGSRTGRMLESDTRDDIGYLLKSFCMMSLLLL